MYLLKDITINKNNEKIRRISNRFDLNKLFDYKIKAKDNNLLFTFEFLKEENLFERTTKNLLFEDKDGELFEEYLIEILEKIDATFLDEIFEKNDDEEEEEDEKEGKIGEEENKEEKDKNEIKDNINIDNENENDNNLEKNKKKEYKKVILEGKDLNLKLSSSREILK